MQVVLKVVGGKNDGREIKIAIPRFIVGRGETAHLRPASDLVSREHTSIEIIEDGKVVITDLNSRNGTFVNGAQITAPHVARAGDVVRIGRLQFEMVIDPAKAGSKKPKVTNVIDAAARTASAKKTSLEDSITDWLLEGGDDDDVPDSRERAAMSMSETVQFNLDETTAIRTDADEVDASDAPVDESSAEDSKETVKPGKKGKPKPMKMPNIVKVQQHDNSTSAADDVLKKFFNRR